MNFDRLLPFVISVVMGAAAIGKVDVLQNWVWRAQVKLLYESRASAWGSPQIFPEHFKKNTKSSHQ